MEQESALAVAVGERVRTHRQARRWTLDQLAAASTVSRRMLVSVEQGVTNPSLGTLLRLAEALGVALPELVEPPAAAEVAVTRRGGGHELWSGPYGGRGVLVASRGEVELWDWSLAPGERYAGRAHPAGTVELVQVQSGSLLLVVAGEEAVLKKGDAARFPGDVAHDYVQSGAGATRFSLVVHEPAGGVRA